MLDLEKDIKIDIHINVAGKRRALANITIGGLITVNSFEIIQAENKKVYVVNPHIISNVYNKTSCKREITYLSTASLLDHKDRKKLVDMILDAYAQKVEQIKIDRSKAEVKNVGDGATYTKDVDMNVKRNYSI